MMRRNGYWQTHPNKELQALLLELDDAGWRITKGSRYYKVFCPCREHPPVNIHLTPSNRYYLNNIRKHLIRHTCLFQLMGGKDD